MIGRLRGRAATALLGLALAAALPVSAAERIKVVLDTDIGTDIDDAWALGFALAHPGFELLGVTVTDGDTAARAKVACKLLARGRDATTCRWPSVAPPRFRRSGSTSSSPGPRTSGPRSRSASPPPSSSWTSRRSTRARSRSWPWVPSRTWPTPCGASRPSAAT